jgi:hypothetical protein
VLFVASLDLIAVASTGLWASIDCLLVAGHGHGDLDLLIVLPGSIHQANFGPWAKFPD